MMIVATVAPQANVIKKIPKSPKIFPIKLDVARIIDRTHIFLHEMDLTNLEYNLKNLTNTYENAKPSLSNTQLTLLKSQIKNIINNSLFKV